MRAGILRVLLFVLACFLVAAAIYLNSPEGGIPGLQATLDAAVHRHDICEGETPAEFAAGEGWKLAEATPAHNSPGLVDIGWLDTVSALPETLEDLLRRPGVDFEGGSLRWARYIDYPDPHRCRILGAEGPHPLFRFTGVVSIDGRGQGRRRELVPAIRAMSKEFVGTLRHEPRAPGTPQLWGLTYRVDGNRSQPDYQMVIRARSFLATELITALENLCLGPSPTLRRASIRIFEWSYFSSWRFYRVILLAEPQAPGATDTTVIAAQLAFLRAASRRWPTEHLARLTSEESAPMTVTWDLRREAATREEVHEFAARYGEEVALSEASVPFQDRLATGPGVPETPEPWIEQRVRVSLRLRGIPGGPGLRP